MFVFMPQSFCLDAPQLYNSFKLTGIAQGVLYHHLAHLLVLVAVLTFSSIGEVDVAVADNPATVVGKRDNVALRVEEEKGLGGADRKAGVCALATGSNLGTDLVLQDLG